jgi:hypothetical protein
VRRSSFLSASTSLSSTGFNSLHPAL